MKRFFVFILLLVAALGIGGKFYSEYQMKEALALLTQKLQPLGTLQYSDVNMTPSGDAQVNQLRFRPHASTDELIIDRVSLRTGNLLGLFYLSREVDKQRIPDHLGVSFTGIRVLTGGDLFRSGEENNNSTRLEALGCGERRHFTGHDLMDMGYQELAMSIDLNYEIFSDGQKIVFSSITTIQDMATMEFKTDIHLGATSRAVTDLSLIHI